jgi:hypothetical protein
LDLLSLKERLKRRPHLGEDDGEVVVEKVATAEVASRIAQPNRSSYGWLELNE